MTGAADDANDRVRVLNSKDIPFDITDGTWREVHPDDPHSDEEVMYRTGPVTRYWVREAPVPQLPTEPYTVIRTEGGEGVAVLDGKDTWRNIVSGNPVHLNRITGFEVLASPPTYTGNQYAEIQKAQRETAKAVLDRVRHEFVVYPPQEEHLQNVAREFGVES